eukprot:12303192-Alexandrium_andersonii.AAC.1
MEADRSPDGPWADCGWRFGHLAMYRFRKFKIASGVRNLNCAVSETTSDSTSEGLVRGGRRHFAR